MTVANNMNAPPQPAEWTPHRGCITAWPWSEEAWGDALEKAQAEFATFLRMFTVHAGEKLYLLTPNGALPPQIADLTGDVETLEIPYGDVWLRDIAPVCLSAEHAVHFAFNGWGGKYRYAHDPEVALSVAEALGIACSEVPLVTEGGAWESDGEGTYLTTRVCLINDNRNPNMGERDVEALLSKHMGARKVLWLDEGLAGDHTDGHIDNIARFVAPHVVVCMRGQADDPNAELLKRVEAQLRDSRDASGRRFVVHTLPSPGAILDDDGQPMPASYMNFYIANRAVFVPSYRPETDAQVCASLADLFPGRRIVRIPSRAILTGGGSLHCVTQQVPV